MIQRSIAVEDVRRVLENGSIIASYPADRPYPSRLVLGWSGRRPLHVLAAEDAASQETVVITVYEPDPGLWERDFKRRRRP
jgi:hypothetical protein